MGAELIEKHENPQLQNITNLQDEESLMVEMNLANDNNFEDDIVEQRENIVLTDESDNEELV